MDVYKHLHFRASLLEGWRRQNLQDLCCPFCIEAIHLVFRKSRPCTYTWLSFFLGQFQCTAGLLVGNRFLSLQLLRQQSTRLPCSTAASFVLVRSSLPRVHLKGKVSGLLEDSEKLELLAPVGLTAANQES